MNLTVSMIPTLKDGSNKDQQYCCLGAYNIDPYDTIDCSWPPKYAVENRQHEQKQQNAGYDKELLHQS